MVKYSGYFCLSYMSHLQLSCLSSPKVFHLWVPHPLLRHIDSAQPGGPLFQAASLLVSLLLMLHGLFHKALAPNPHA